MGGKLYVSITQPKYVGHGLMVLLQMYTEEARKQRNRDAQAAFRERRIEYIKELEERVKAYSARLRAVEAKRTDSADECLMLRYKNSLLERILLHKGEWFIRREG